MDKIYSIKESTLTGIANAVRSKTGKTDGIEIENMEAEIDSIVAHDPELDAVISEQVGIVERLETAIQNKAIGSGYRQWIRLADLPATYGYGDGPVSEIIYNIEIPENTLGLYIAIVYNEGSSITPMAISGRDAVANGGYTWNTA